MQNSFPKRQRASPSTARLAWATLRPPPPPPHIHPHFSRSPNTIAPLRHHLQGSLALVIDGTPVYHLILGPGPEPCDSSTGTCERLGVGITVSHAPGPAATHIATHPAGLTSEICAATCLRPTGLRRPRPKSWNQHRHRNALFQSVRAVQQPSPHPVLSRTPPPHDFVARFTCRPSNSIPIMSLIHPPGFHAL